MKNLHYNSRLIVVSNRLPISLFKGEEGWETRASSGGLVTALGPVLRDRGGYWIGWTGTTRKDLDLRVLKRVLGPESRQMGYRLVPVLLNQEEIDNYYYGFSNEVIWPLFHDLQTICRFDPLYWESYNSVNDTFARVLSRHSKEHDFLWINDYHLIPLARSLKERGYSRRCFFFLHITFPPRDIFLKLPWRERLLRDLMDFDMVGFQTVRDRRNFIDCLRVFDRQVHVTGKGPVLVTVQAFGKRTRVAALPISIDFEEFARMAGTFEAEEKTAEVKYNINCEHIMLGVDRLDYTKGIPEKLWAFRTALEKYPELREKISLVQILVPSREDVPAYQNLKSEVEMLVSQINGEFTTPGWTPVVYSHRSVPRQDLVAFYRAADIGLITSLKDGMNLVSKEYCACHINNDGVLLLSEFAGSAMQLGRNAILINPHDRQGTADAIYNAVHMSEKEKYNRMSAMRRSIRKRDVFWWVNNFLRASMNRRLRDFPESEIAPFIPQRVKR